MAHRPPEPPLNIKVFWEMFSRMVGRHLQERAHAEITLVLQEGSVRIVRINRTYRPDSISEP